MAAKKTAAKKTSTAKKTTAKTSTAKTSTAKTSMAKKTTAKKSMAKTSTAKKVAKSDTKTALPTAAVEAFSGSAATALKLGKDDLLFFKGFVKKDQQSPPPPTARYLKLFRRLAVLKGPAGGHLNVVATVDLSQLPEEWAAWKQPGAYGYPYVLRLMFDMLEQLLKSMGVPQKSYFIGSGFVSFMVKAAQADRVLPLVKLHESFIAKGPLFLGKVAKAWALYEPMTIHNLEKALLDHERLLRKTKG